MKLSNKPLSRTDEIVVQELDGEVLIYDLRANKAFCLNETSALIWHACDGNRDVAELTRFLAKRLNAKVNEDLVWLALDQLKQHKLLETAPDTLAKFGGMSRRKVMRKVGVGVMVAVPVVAALIVPPAASAATGCGVCVCNDNAWTTGEICMTGMNGMPCPVVTPTCGICRANAPAAMNAPGTCFTA